jgi:hypothetical protein
MEAAEHSTGTLSSTLELGELVRSVRSAGVDPIRCSRPGWPEQPVCD